MQQQQQAAPKLAALRQTAPRLASQRLAVPRLSAPRLEAPRLAVIVKKYYIYLYLSLQYDQTNFTWQCQEIFYKLCGSVMRFFSKKIL